MNDAEYHNDDSDDSIDLTGFDDDDDERMLEDIDMPRRKASKVAPSVLSPRVILKASFGNLTENIMN